MTDEIDRDTMSEIAMAVDTVLHGKPGGSTYGFVVLAFPLNMPTTKVSYISNAKSAEVNIALKAFLAKDEGSYHEGTGTLQ